MPRAPFIKPDFHAHGPRVLINNIVNLEAGEHPYDVQAQYDVEELDDISQPPIRYYPSHKVLGKLYRAIDEQKFFEEIQTHPRHLGKSLPAQRNLLHRVWKYVEEKTALIQWQHYENFAREIKEE